MDCPKCGAVNPEGAEHCNLCFYSFFERPAPEPIPEPVPDRTSPEDFVSIEPQAAVTGVFSARVITQALQGAAAALGGGLLFLLSLGILQAVGVTALSFMFTGLGLDVSALKTFILAAALFAAFCGGVGGNLDGKRDAVPAIRMMAGLIGLGIWVGLILAAKPADAVFTVWLTGSISGVIVALASFPLIAAFIGASESLGEDIDFDRARYGAACGLAAGLATAIAAGLVLLLVPVFGTATPAGFLAVTGFAIKLTIAVCLIGGLFGLGLWLGIGVADERA